MAIAKENIFCGIPTELPEELETLLVSGHEFRLKRIVSRGHSTAVGEWYDQAEIEWVILLSGGAILEFEENGTTLPMKPGDCIVIPAHCRHRLTSTEPGIDSVWLALYFLTNNPAG